MAPLCPNGGLELLTACVARTLRGPQRRGGGGVAAFPGCPWTAGDVTSPHGAVRGPGKILACTALQEMSREAPRGQGWPLVRWWCFGESYYLIEYAFSAHYRPFWGLAERVCPEDSTCVSLTPTLLLAPRCSPLGSYPAPPHGPPCYVIRAGFT